MNNDLISRSALIAAIKTNSPTFYDGQDIADWQAKCINEAPAVDAEPVRHGEWIYDPNATDWGIGGYVCSECHTKNNNLPCNEFKNPLRFVGSNFCPHCGARMDGGTDNDYRHDHQ